MTDRELLELAAKAVGKSNLIEKYGVWYADGYPFNPLTNDGDAFRLAVKLCIDIDNMTDASYCEGPYGQDAFVEIENNDPYAATRRAIVRVAAKMGK